MRVIGRRYQDDMSRPTGKEGVQAEAARCGEGGKNAIAG
jgi:hypothetical protein